MKIPIKLNKSGRKSAEDFLRKYDKYCVAELYDIEAGVDLISTKACEAETPRFELSSVYTYDKRPACISFLDSEIDFEEIED